ncbi:MAG: hypothetical protein R3E79_08015 [Caldilineaceae bacterium]
MSGRRMTRYASLEVVTQISEKLMGTDAAQTFFGTFDMQAFVLIQPVDGSLFAGRGHQSAGYVLRLPSAYLGREWKSSFSRCVMPSLPRLQPNRVT